MPKHTTLVVFLVGSCLCGCGKPIDKDTLLGKWKTPMGMEEEYKSDGTETGVAFGFVGSGKWAFAKMEANKLTITERPDGVTVSGTPFPVVTIEITFEGADKMRSVVSSNPAAPTIEYDRVK